MIKTILFLLIFVLSACSQQDSKPNEVSISFDFPGVKDLIIESGESIKTLPTPTKEGYLLYGWYLDETLNQRYEITMSVKDSIILFPRWIPDGQNLFIVTIESINLSQSRIIVSLNGDLSLNGYHGILSFDADDIVSFNDHQNHILNQQLDHEVRFLYSNVGQKITTSRVLFEVIVDQYPDLLDVDLQIIEAYHLNEENLPVLVPIELRFIK